MKELFIKYKVFRSSTSKGEIEWDIIPVREVISVKETVKSFETHLLFGRDYYDVEIMSVNLV